MIKALTKCLRPIIFMKCIFQEKWVVKMTNYNNSWFCHVHFSGASTGTHPVGPIQAELRLKVLLLHYESQDEISAYKQKLTKDRWTEYKANALILLSISTTICYTAQRPNAYIKLSNMNYILMLQFFC